MTRTMISGLLIVVSTTTLALNLDAQSDKVDGLVREVFDKQEEAWNKGDIPSFMDTYWRSDELVFLSDAGAIYGWQHTLDRYYTRYPDRQAMGHLTFDIEKVTRRSDHLCTVIGYYHLARKDLDDLEGHFLILVEQIEGEWLIVADSTH